MQYALYLNVKFVMKVYSLNYIEYTYYNTTVLVEIDFKIKSLLVEIENKTLHLMYIVSY